MDFFAGLARDLMELCERSSETTLAGSCFRSMDVSEFQEKSNSVKLLRPFAVSNFGNWLSCLSAQSTFVLVHEHTCGQLGCLGWALVVLVGVEVVVGVVAGGAVVVVVDVVVELVVVLGAAVVLPLLPAGGCAEFVVAGAAVVLGDSCGSVELAGSIEACSDKSLGSARTKSTPPD